MELINEFVSAHDGGHPPLAYSVSARSGNITFAKIVIKSSELFQEATISNLIPATPYNFVIFVENSRFDGKNSPEESLRVGVRTLGTPWK